MQYIKGQLGHESVQTTEKHYARWIGDDEYREPMALREGEIPAHLLMPSPREAPPNAPGVGS